MPVTTPTAKLRPKIRIQNRAASFQSSPPGRAHGFHEDDQKGQPHGELGEQVVVGDRERELQPVKDERVRHLAGPGTK
jgi:hypothetical protein